MKLIYEIPDDEHVQPELAKHTILETSLAHGIPHAHACGGKARCSTCRVMVLEGLEHCTPRTEREHALASRLQFTPAVRLACQTLISGEVRLRRLVLDDEDIRLTDAQDKSQPSVVGDEKHVAVMFTDIRGFTPFSEKLLPYDIIHVLNRYLNLLGTVIHRYDGIITNYTGDGIMAIFEAGLTDDAEIRAVHAGIEMLEMMDRFKPYLLRTYGREFDMGVGIHCGEVVVGNLGVYGRQVVTAIGAVVNFASRVESANKDAGTRLLVSEAVYRKIEAQVEIGTQTTMPLKGQTGEFTLFEIIGLTN